MNIVVDSDEEAKRLVDIYHEKVENFEFYPITGQINVLISDDN